ncbi:MAG: hypothetical protein ACTSSC_04705, partial [Promethearchaeota archaeon]
MEKNYRKLYFLIGIFLINCVFTFVFINSSKFQNDTFTPSLGDDFVEKVNDYPNLAQISGNFSRYNLSVIMD